MNPSRIALVGDYDGACTAHIAIPQALARACQGQPQVSWEWVPSPKACAPGALNAFAGVWLVPKSPYESMDGALAAARFARTRGIPFLGTCGGFQHALIEIARNVAGIGDADHAETSPEGANLVVSRLSCSLVDTSGRVRFAPGSLIRSAYGSDSSEEGYHCNYGLDRRFRSRLEASGIVFTCHDDAGEIRGAELKAHPFFVGVLFQPERGALLGRTPPLVKAFVEACGARSPTGPF